MTNLNEVDIGPLHFVPLGEIPFDEGGHLTVAVRGKGEAGQRPLLGHLTMTKAEWWELLKRVELWKGHHLAALRLDDAAAKAVNLLQEAGF